MVVFFMVTKIGSRLELIYYEYSPSRKILNYLLIILEVLHVLPIQDLYNFLTKGNGCVYVCMSVSVSSLMLPNTNTLRI